LARSGGCVASVPAAGTVLLCTHRLSVAVADASVAVNVPVGARPTVVIVVTSNFGTDSLSLGGADAGVTLNLPAVTYLVVTTAYRG